MAKTPGSYFTFTIVLSLFLGMALLLVLSFTAETQTVGADEMHPTETPCPPDNESSEEPKWIPWPTPTPDPRTGEGFANPVVGGELVSRDDQVSLYLPGGATSIDAKLWYEQVVNDIQPPAGESYVGSPFTIRVVAKADERVSLCSELKEPLTIVFRYTDAQAVGLAPSTFALAYYDGTYWVKIPGTVNTEAKTVTAQTNACGILFSLLGSRE